MTEFGIFPTAYQLKFLFPISQGEIYADWLITANRELYEATKAYDWTTKMYENPIPVENVRFVGGSSCIRSIRSLMSGGLE